MLFRVPARCLILLGLVLCVALTAGVADAQPVTTFVTESFGESHTATKIYNLAVGEKYYDIDFVYDEFNERWGTGDLGNDVPPNPAPSLPWWDSDTRAGTFAGQIVAALNTENVARAGDGIDNNQIEYIGPDIEGNTPNANGYLAYDAVAGPDARTRRIYYSGTWSVDAASYDQAYSDSLVYVDGVQVPEPSSFVLAVLAFAGVLATRRWRRRKAGKSQMDNPLSA